MSDKPSSTLHGKDLLGLIFVAGGLMLQIFCTRHSLPYELGLAAMFAGFAIQSFGSYFFVPAVFFVTGTLLSLGPKIWEIPSLVVMALGFIIGIYGWWKKRSALPSDKGSA